MSELSHFDTDGAARMVDVGDKQETLRQARASAQVRMQPDTIRQIRNRKLSKGDVIEVARLAGIMATKRTADLIPLCHVLTLDSVNVSVEVLDEQTLSIEATVKTTGRTGVEMEALTAVSVTALTIYDMCKSIDRGITIREIRLEEKSGGKSGNYHRDTKSFDTS